MAKVNESGMSQAWCDTTAVFFLVSEATPYRYLFKRYRYTGKKHDRRTLRGKQKENKEISMENKGTRRTWKEHKWEVKRTNLKL